MTVELHVLTRNEEQMLPFTLAHYSSFCSRIVVHDSFSTDRTREIAGKFSAQVVDWDTGDKFNDQAARMLKSTCWHGTNADRVIVIDCDELVVFPEGVVKTLEASGPIVKPQGYEMLGYYWPNDGESILAAIPHGARDDKWYGKPIIFSPKLVGELEFSAGAHSIEWAKGPTGKPLRIPKEATSPTVKLLHYHHVGPIEEIARRYDESRARFAQVNIDHRWGIQTDGMTEALRKRELILAKLERVV